MSDNPSQLYDEQYFLHGCGSPYERSDEWLQFFGAIADRIVRGISPGSVLDVGCAMGFLVEGLRDRGVEAYGLDVSEYAIEHVRDDLKSCCWVGSVLDSLPRRYDLVVCIEVLEHLRPQDAETAVAHLCAAGSDILVSSSPSDYDEVTHFNVQPPEYWASLFAQHDFIRDVEFDASFVTPWAARFRKRQELLHRIIEPYERKLWSLSTQVATLRDLAVQNRAQMIEKAQVLQQVAAEKDQAFQQVVAQKDQALQQVMVERERSEEMLTCRLTEWERGIQDLQEHNKELERALKDQTRDERETVRVLQAEVAGREQTVHALESQLADWEAHWEGVQRSLAWSLVTRLRSTRQLIAPPSTKRGRLWSSVVRRSRVGKPTVTPHARPDVGPRQIDLGTSYENWARWCEELRYDRSAAERTIGTFARRPSISLIMPVYDTQRDYLLKAVESVLNQYYPDWELCICDDASPSPHIRPLLKELAAKDSRIRITFSEHNGGIAVASNQALALASGEYVGLLDHDDELTPDALYEVVKTLQEVDADLIYSDEDKLDGDGQRCSPFFKPAWSPDLLLSCMYTSHLSVYRKELVDAVGRFRTGFDGSQDHDLALRFTECASQIVHIPKILYHWRQAPGSAAASTVAKPYAYTAAVQALVDALRRREVAGDIHPQLSVPGFYDVRRSIAHSGKVTIIIPTRDNPLLLQRCIGSIESQTSYPNYEILIVDNGSSDETTLEYLRRTPHRVLRDDGPFNYARLNNRAGREADGEYLLLLNDDTEVLSGDWLTAMVEHAQRPEVGAVGAKLIYPNGRIQHAGVILGLGGVAGHFQDVSAGHIDIAYPNFPNTIRNYSAVTGACMMVRRDLYHEIGGLDEENLPVGFNDIDFCLRLRQKGYLIVYTPLGMLEHRESATRSKHVDEREVAYMLRRWPDQIESDPYYHPCLSLVAGEFSLDVARPDSLSCVYAQTVSNDVVGPITETQTIGQMIRVPRDGFNGISIKLANYGMPCGEAIRLRLRESSLSNQDLRVVEVDGAAVRDNSYHTFGFAPLADSQDKEYYFYLEVVDSTRPGEITAWKSIVIDPRAGPYYEKHRRREGSLSFKLFCQAPVFRVSNHSEVLGQERVGASPTPDH